MRNAVEVEKVRIQATRVFFANKNATGRVVLNRGGARSSKSYSICQLLLHKLLYEQRKKILVVRKYFPSMRLSCYALWKDLVHDWGVEDVIEERKQDWNFVYGGGLIHFGALDDPEKIKSTDWNYIWMEEANEFFYDDFTVLKLRLSAPSRDKKRNQMFLSFNPVDEFSYLKTKILDGKKEDVQEIHSTFRDNPFLDDDYIQSLVDLEAQDVNYYRIYALGEWGRLEHLIYPNWDLAECPTSFDLETIYGLDFGFNAPTALVRCDMNQEGDVWEKEMLYETNLTNAQLIERLGDLVENKDSQIYADSAEPQRIEDIQNAGFNIWPADKDVRKGIDTVKRMRIHIHPESENLIKEKRSYSYKVDRAGRILDDPIKFNDHAMSAERYALHSYDLGVGGGPGFFVVGGKA